MTSGILFGKAELAAGVQVQVGDAIPGLNPYVLNLRFCNRSTSPLKLRVAITGAVAPAATDFITYDFPSPGPGIHEELGLVVSPGEKIFVQSAAGNVTVRVHGHKNMKAGGLLGKAALAAGVDTAIGPQLAAGESWTVNVRFCNRNQQLGKVRLAVVAGGGAPVNADFVTYDMPVLGPGLLEDMAIVLEGGERLWARSNLDNFSVRAFGFKE